ncbi:FAD-dependent oxidoreductase [Actinokineospora sp.]|uniref:FAD-dependent oxidoreductase n=1 Tax=Actinokineospora sp. TaxID=1872133 RepID=UPI004037C8E7
MRRVVIAGGSLAGLLAARVLRDVADEIVVVEPDDLPDGPHNRAGSAHGEQFHILLGLAQTLFAHWFPGLLDRLFADGAVPCATDDGRMFVDGRMRPPIPGDPLLPIQRPLLEWHIRREVLALPAVRLVGDRVVGLTANRGRVDGVRLASGGSIGPADLVVDATGRATRLADWLLRLDFEPPPKRRVGLDLGYATALFHRFPGQRLDDLLAVHSVRSAAWAEPGVSCVAPAGPDRWICTVSGYGADRPTRDQGEFRQRCLREPAAGFAALVRDCAPTGPVAVHRFPHSLRRDFHELRRFPAGLVVVGDAVASFNPIYGQGMPSAALHASALGAWLAGGEDVFGYFRRLRVLVDAAWQTSVIEDFRLPHVTGERPRGHRLIQAVSAAISRATMTDPVVARRFADVINMRAHPSELRRPGILGRTFISAVTAGRPGVERPDFRA